MRLWIDSDVGDNPDDAVALVAAAAHPAVDLVGVSTTGGKTEWRAELARHLVDTDVVPGERPDELAAQFSAANVDAVRTIGPEFGTVTATLQPRTMRLAMQMRF